MFAVIKTGGKQYSVAADDVIKIEKLDAEAGDAVTFEEVLVVGDDNGTTIGTPTVEGASVAGEVVEQTRTRKVMIFKKRRRKNYRRRNGHRQHLSVVRITEILTGGKAAKPAKKAKAEPVEEKAEPTAKAAAPAAAAEMVPLFTAPEGAADDLKKISGVGPVLEKKLNALGITQFAQIAAFSADDITRVDAVLNFKGRIEREDWIGQAGKLAAGEDPKAS